MIIANKYDCVEIQMGLNQGSCGHAILLSKEHYDECCASRRGFYCTVCGTGPRVFIGKTTVEQLRTELAAAKDREETLRAQHRQAEEALSKERIAKARLKKRVSAGVCPCCHRTVKQMAKHIKTKHPDFIEESRGPIRGVGQ